ncbi:MAG TPA: dihydrodipicolinate synthase family protein [Bryobacteraceae bacterium]|nr:dihydrodipicolinate synthase family protein [Bryobacteraceae bacterium]
MKTSTVSLTELEGVFAVPPLARHNDKRRSLDFAENDRLVRHIIAGGITRLVYGGNAFLYHVTLAEYEALLDWLAGMPENIWAIPSAGPSYGRAMDQSAALKRHNFPCVMLLPCGDPRDAAGLERGFREFADAAEKKLILYLKDTSNFGSDKEAGLDVAARLVEDGVCVGIKYAVVLDNPLQDPYLDGLLRRVDRRRVISGMGERPAICHLRDFQLPGFTTGSGCVAPFLSNALFETCRRADWEEAATIRANFLPLEDLRDAWGPARVLHAATELADFAKCGPLIPYVTALAEGRLRELSPVARELAERDRTARTGIAQSAPASA